MFSEKIVLDATKISKIGALKGYERELYINAKYLENIGKFFLDNFAAEVDEENLKQIYENICCLEYVHFPYTKYSFRDLCVAITDDLFRYASYHNVEKRDDESYAISESVRASYFIKWITKIKPLFTHALLKESSYEKKFVEKSTRIEVKINKNLFLLENSNEYLALLSSIYILDITGEKDKAFEEIHKIFPLNELQIIFYSLRYRINHQDSYTLLMKAFKKAELTKNQLN